jgi:monovalent cation/hydrogen antiporter
VRHVRRRIEDPPIEIALAVLTGYLAFLPAAAIGVSGVLAAVTAGVYMGWYTPELTNVDTRLTGNAFWEILTFLVNALLFVLVGLQLRPITQALSGSRDYVADAVLICVSVIVLRLVWVPIFTYLLRFLFRSVRERDPYPPWQAPAVISWSGIRGGVSLAAALALPTGFPDRDLIVFVTFCVIVVTLVGQGLSLPAVIRALGLAGDQGAICELAEAQRIVLETALRHVEEARAKDDLRWAGLYDDLAQHYRERLEALAGSPDGNGPEVHRKYNDLVRELLQVEREAAIRLRNERRISDEVLRQIEHDVDLREARLMGGVFQ